MTPTERDRPDVLLATEGTYPFSGGGVGTWCHQLCEGISSADFTLLAVTGHGEARWQYARPASVKRVLHVPLWPGEEPEVYLHPGSYADTLRRRWRTQGADINAHFVPALRVVLREVFLGPRDTGAFVDALVHMGEFLRRNDYKTSMRHPATWDAMLAALDAYSRSETARGAPPPTLADATTCARWLYNMLMPLAVPLPPETTVFHATAAASCALPGIAARRLEGVPLLLTEHGVYVRERYLAVCADDFSDTRKRFLTGIAAAIARACYATADLVAPVATYNTRWELPFGATPERLRVIHNGVDTSRFHPRPDIRALSTNPHVAVAAARVYPLKDIETLIRATDLARREVRDIEVRVYGALDADPAYADRCRILATELSLGEHFQLRGVHTAPHELYPEGAISVLSSISEGFPYTVLESMACGVPCVGTDVGGVREAIGDTGIVVPPRDPQSLARGMVALLTDPLRCEELAARARARVIERFSIAQQLASYAALYRELHEQSPRARGARGAA